MPTLGHTFQCSISILYMILSTMFTRLNNTCHCIIKIHTFILDYLIYILLMLNIMNIYQYKQLINEMRYTFVFLESTIVLYRNSTPATTIDMISPHDRMQNIPATFFRFNDACDPSYNIKDCSLINFIKRHVIHKTLLIF